MNDPLYMKEPFTKWQAWCDLILSAYFAPCEFFVRNIKVKCKRGCVYRGAVELAERWRWSRGKVERFLDYLVEDKRITIQKNKVVSCITILNYEKFQQNETTNESTNDATNRSTNEHLIRRNKEDSNNINAESPNRDIGFGEEQMNMLLQMQEQLAELKERLYAQETEKKPRKKKEANPLITKGREIFESRYSDLFEGGVYYWQAKDAAAMDSLTKKIIHSRKQKGMSVEEEDVLKGLTAFLNSIKDPWLLKNFSVTSINGKYNEIVAQARAAVTNGNSNGVNQSNKEARAQDAASIIARLAAQEGSDDNPIRG